jgi:CRP/FNR family cyclic AMP-dependent transcriptional regulator
VSTTSPAEPTSPLLKKFFQRLKGQSHGPDGAPSDRESGFFSTLFQDRGEDGMLHSTWPTRALEIRAEAFDRARGTELFSKLWGEDRHFAALSADDLTRLSTYLEFAQISPNQEVIGQNEQGDYLVVVLDGTVAVDRVQPWGGRARLAEAHAGDMLGEMSLLDAGARFSACTTLTPTLLAVLDARRLDEMIDQEPRLAVALLASLSRRLSLRLRQVSARLSALLSRS